MADQRVRRMNINIEVSMHNAVMQFIEDYVAENDPAAKKKGCR